MAPGLKITFDDMIEATKKKTKEKRREEIVKLVSYFIRDLDDPEQQEVNKRLIVTYTKELNELQ
jgi:hypothetical protein